MILEPAHRAELGLGLAAIGRPAYITVGREADLGEGRERSVEVMRERAHRLLDAAWALGVRYVDAARSYGLAEQFLGSWLDGHPDYRSRLTVGSKWGYEYVGDWQLDAETQERKQHSLRMFDEQWPQTVAALGAPPDVYLVHSLTPESPALDDARLLDRLRELAATGVRVGFSTSGPSQATVVRSVLALPDSPFSAVQTTWNLLEPSAAPALAEAHDAGWLVVVKEALANGRLTSRGGEMDALAQAARLQLPLETLALVVAAAQPWADIVLSGAVTAQQLSENVAATADTDVVLAEHPVLMKDYELPENPLLATNPGLAENPGLAKNRGLAENPERYWAARAARAWQ